MSEVEDLFRTSFKKYKSVKIIKELFQQSSKNGESKEVVLLDLAEEDVENSLVIRNLEEFNEKGYSRFGLQSPNTWKVYEFKFPKGLLLIKNPFTAEGQRYWIKRSVIDFPKEPFITNIDNLEIKEGISIKAKLDRNEFYKKLRWVTFGYHHDWDTKVYSEDSKCEFPQDLADLTKFIATILGFSDFKAEASIANYYHLDSTLSGHVDRSEVNQSAPLFSMSFGQPAVFLIGGQTKSVKPQAVLLRSGDIAVMSGESRLSYHGVPKILYSPDEPWNNSEKDEKQYEISSPKKPKLEVDDSNEQHFDKNLDISEAEWSEFLKAYVSKSRINLNIRQVLFPGQTQLSQKP